jgi:hypothetical protein
MHTPRAVVLLSTSPAWPNSAWSVRTTRTARLPRDDAEDAYTSLRNALPGLSNSPRKARALVAGALGGLSPNVLQLAQLLTNELVTNAVLHARTGLQLDIGISVSTVRVSVEDYSSAFPQQQAPCSSNAVRNRALEIVDRVSSSWGWERIDGGKRVWFELAVE